MIRLNLPVKETKFGPVKSLADFMAAIRTYGQDFLGNGVPACQVIPNAPCDVSCYQYWGKNSHGGLDIPAPEGTPIYASTQGVVQEVSNDVSAGLGVVIWDDYQKIKTLYWHNLRNLVSVGQRVQAGDHIADVDSTGYSTGHHLHFELKRTDDKGNTIDKDNGWRGAIDPTPFLVFGEDMYLLKQRDRNEVWLINPRIKTRIWILDPTTRDTLGLDILEGDPSGFVLSLIHI